MTHIDHMKFSNFVYTECTSSTSMVAKDPVLVVKLQLESTFSKAILSNAHSRHITVSSKKSKKSAIQEHWENVYLKAGYSTYKIKKISFTLCSGTKRPPVDKWRKKNHKIIDFILWGNYWTYITNIFYCTILPFYSRLWDV